MRLLIADDDIEHLDLTAYALRRSGFEVVCVNDGADAVERVRSDAPDLVLLDITMPRLDGIAACRALSDRGTPVIIVSGRDDEETVIAAFGSGADDYIVKPFSHRQLALRIRAVLARCMGRAPREPALQLRIGRLAFDVQGHELRDGASVTRLTSIECRLLHMLALNADHVVTSERLIEAGWGYDGGDTFALKTHISHLRRKIGAQRSAPGDISSIVRVGYVLRTR